MNEWIDAWMKGRKDEVCVCVLCVSNHVWFDNDRIQKRICVGKTRTARQVHSKVIQYSSLFVTRSNIYTQKSVSIDTFTSKWPLDFQLLLFRINKTIINLVRFLSPRIFHYRSCHPPVSLYQLSYPSFISNFILLSLSVLRPFPGRFVSHQTKTSFLVRSFFLVFLFCSSVPLLIGGRTITSASRSPLYYPYRFIWPATTARKIDLQTNHCRSFNLIWFDQLFRIEKRLQKFPILLPVWLSLGDFDRIVIGRSSTSRIDLHSDRLGATRFVIEIEKNQSETRRMK